MPMLAKRTERATVHRQFFSFFLWTDNQQQFCVVLSGGRPNNPSLLIVHLLMASDEGSGRQQEKPGW